MEFSGFFHVADVPRSFHLQHRVMRELYQVLVGLGPQVCVQSSEHNQSGSLRESTKGVAQALLILHMLSHIYLL